MLTNIKTHLLFASTIFLQGCTPSEEELWGLGSFVFVVFLLIVILNAVVPTIQEYEPIKKFLTCIEKLIIKYFKYLIILPLTLVTFGIFIILRDPDRSPSDLIFFIGILFLYLLINMKKWATEKDMFKKRNQIRVMGLATSFIFMMLYIMAGAPNLSL